MQEYIFCSWSQIFVHQRAYHCSALFVSVLSIYIKTKCNHLLKMVRQIRANILASTVACQSRCMVTDLHWLVYEQVEKQLHNDRTSLHGNKIMKQNFVQ